MQHFYAAYSGLRLTKKSDRAKAVAGLQRRIAHTLDTAAIHGVLWSLAGRTLLWRAAEPGKLTRIEYPAAAAPPPSWSWMAYDGRITFLEIPFDEVQWMGRVHIPPPGRDLGTWMEASKLRIDNTQLMERAVLDVQDVEFVEGAWRCVLVGRGREGEDHNDAFPQYVLLIRPLSLSLSSDRPGDAYERVGVAILLGIHVSEETSPVFVV